MVYATDVDLISGADSGCEISKLIKLAKYLVRRSQNALAYALRGELYLLVQRALELVKGELRASDPLEVGCIAILSAQHSLSVAKAYSESFIDLGFEVVETDHYSHRTNADLWIVFGAQILVRLPPSDRRIIVQLEQTSNERWFSRRYKARLKNSLAVIEFSGSNLIGLRRFGIEYPQVFLVKLGCMQRSLSESSVRDIDVLFYGDPYCDRRQRFLDVLSSRFNLHIASDCFGLEMFELISRAKLVVNIHYYEHANLESTRIFECLALGTKVVSEQSPDVDEYDQSLSQLVDFVPVGEIDQMCDAVVRNLSGERKESFPQNLERFRTLVNGRLIYNLARVLVGVGVDLPDNYLLSDRLLTGNPVILALPETTDRFQRAKSHFPSKFEIFEGLRSKQSWKGCGLSYQAISRIACQQQLSRLWIFEDDAELPENSDAMLTIIESYLDQHGGEWDIFCGVIARFDQLPKVIDVKEFRGVKFVVLDQMMSMVANHYSSRVLKLLSNWTPNESGVDQNTIDQYLNRHVRRVVTTIPFQFGHDISEFSTLWGISNSGYSHLLRRTEEELAQLVLAFEEEGEAACQ